MTPPSHKNVTVAAALNESHTSTSVSKAVQHLLDNLDRPLKSIVKIGDHVLVKVNMACSGLRNPEDRVTTHPLVVMAIITALQDCGAIVFFGDDVARVGKHCSQLWKTTGMWKVAQYTGATLVDFVAVGAREVRGSLVYPRKYLVTNAYFDADVVINAANCRSHPNIILSGAIKNMFGFVVGVRKALIHQLFWDDPRKFGRAIADIYRTIPADLSFLDLTTVREGGSPTPAIRPVGLMLASSDPVAVDTVAAAALGYDKFPVWTTIFASNLGVGCNNFEAIDIRGVEWNGFQRTCLEPPLLDRPSKKSLYDRATNFANHTIFRPRPVIAPAKCTGCGECADRCPVHCIATAPDDVFNINLRECVDCGCCIKVCEQGAVNMEHVGVGKAVRVLAGTIKSRALNRG